MTETYFNEAGAAVDNDFVRFGSVALRLSEVKVVNTSTMSEDAHVAPVLWVFAVLMLILALGTPILFVFVVVLAGAALYKQENRKPLVHMLFVSTGGITNSRIYKSTDGEHVERLRAAIERAVAETRAASAAHGGIASPTRARPQPVENRSGPWGSIEKT